MSSPNNNNNNSPRRELQGPRPAPLRIRKDSHKINKKPPVAPQPPHQNPHPPPPRREPVIIYAVSPKVIHTDPGEFMKLVQRLTGSSSSSSSSSSCFASQHQEPEVLSLTANRESDAVSPAARFASIEKSRPQEQYGRKQLQENHLMGFNGIDDMFVERTAVGFPGILSPGPSSLRPVVPSNFFLPSDPSPSLYLPSDPSPSFFHDLSPLLRTNRSFMPSPTNFVSPHLSSPTLPLDFFNNLLDF